MHNQNRGQKLLAILLDPDKIIWEDFQSCWCKKINQSHNIYSLAEVKTNKIERVDFSLKTRSILPMVLFQETIRFQISNAILFLSLISGEIQII
jgi:putative glycerol-1-phosphate prenyltransferase